MKNRFNLTEKHIVEIDSARNSLRKISNSMRKEGPKVSKKKYFPQNWLSETQKNDEKFSKALETFLVIGKLLPISPCRSTYVENVPLYTKFFSICLKVFAPLFEKRLIHAKSVVSRLPLTSHRNPGIQVMHCKFNAPAVSFAFWLQLFMKIVCCKAQSGPPKAPSLLV